LKGLWAGRQGTAKRAERIQGIRKKSKVEISAESMVKIFSDYLLAKKTTKILLANYPFFYQQ